MTAYPDFSHLSEPETPDQVQVQEPPLFTPAGIGRRGLGYIIDQILSYFLGVVIAALLVLVAGNGGAVYIAESASSWQRMMFQYAGLNPTLAWTTTGIIFFTPFVYRFLFELILGRTPGKMITKTRIIGGDGQKSDWVGILQRNLWYLVGGAMVTTASAIVGVICIIVAAVTIKTSPTSQSLFDKYARTYVIMK